MHTFLDNFCQGEKFSDQVARCQVELRREEKFTDPTLLNISSLQTDYINLDSSSGFGRNSERADAVQKKFTVCGSTNHSAETCFKRIRQDTRFLRFLSNPFETFFCRVISTSTKSALFLNIICSLTISPKKLSCYQDLNNHSLRTRWSMIFDL